jgi:aerobic carbon-monoxide dehydrogenase large subunit
MGPDLPVGPPRPGQQAHRYLNYPVPRADVLPNMSVDFSPVPSKSNPIGVKGVGEGGTVAATPTVMNAIIDALAPLGVGDLPMPATAERVWRAIHSHGKTAGAHPDRR